MGNNRNAAKLVLKINDVIQKQATIHTVSSMAGGESEATFELLGLGNNHPQAVAPFNTFAHLHGQIVKIELQGFFLNRIIHIGEIVRIQDTDNSAIIRSVTPSALIEWAMGSELIAQQYTTDPWELDGTQRETTSKELPSLNGNLVIKGQKFGCFSTLNGKKYAQPVFTFHRDNPNFFDQITIPDLIKALLVDNVGVQNSFRYPKSLDSIYADNIIIRPGMEFFDSLKAILGPYGYSFRLNFALSSFEIFNTDGSTYTPLNIRQRRTQGTDFDDRLDLVVSRNLVHSSEQTYSSATYWFSDNLIETTVLLAPGWDRSLDDTDINDLMWDSPAMIANDKLRDVWRKWIPADPTFNGLFSQDDIYPRPFKPCISVDSQGKPYGSYHGVHITFTEQKFADSKNQPKPSDHKPVEQSSKNPAGIPTEIEILQDEAGIRFVGRTLPFVLKEYEFGLPTIRTITPEVDRIIKLFATASVQQSPEFESDSFKNKSRKSFVLDVSDRFPNRKIVDNGSILANLLPKAQSLDLVVFADDDSVNFRKSINEQVRRFSISGELVIHGLENIDVMDAIGRPVVSAKGMNLARDPDGVSYPICTGWVMDVKAQQTTLLIG